MAVCPKCGSNLAGNELECPGCGVILAKARMSPSLSPPSSPLAQPSPARPKKKTVGQRALFTLGGVACLLGIMPIAIWTWSSLPPGRYPVIIAGLPALPLLWLSFVCFGRADLGLEEFARRRPGLFKLSLYLVFAALAIGFIIVLDAMGKL